MTTHPDRALLLLSAQRALLGEVSECLRAVAISRRGKAIRLEFYFDGAIGFEDREGAERVASEVVADFPDGEIETKLRRVDAPEPLETRGHWVFRRREAD